MSEQSKNPSEYIAPRVFIPWASDVDHSMRGNSIGFIPVYESNVSLACDHDNVENTIKVPVRKQSQ